MVIGPTPPGTGVMAPRPFGRLGIGDVADQPPVGQPVDADIDHHGPRRDPVAAHHLRPARGGDQDLGAAALGGQVAGARMRDRHGGVRAPSAAPPAGGPTSVDRPSTSARSPAGATPAVCQQLHHAERRAGHQRRAAAGEQAGIQRVEARPRPWPGRSRRCTAAVRICRGSGNCTRMPSTAGSALSRATSGQQLGLGGGGGQADGLRGDAGRGGGAVLAAHIDRAGRVVADQHHRQARLVAPGGDAAAISARSAAATALPSMTGRSQRGQPRGDGGGIAGHPQRLLAGWSRRRDVDRRTGTPSAAASAAQAARLARPSSAGSRTAIAAVAVGSRAPALQPGMAGLRLDLHRHRHAVRRDAPEHRQKTSGCQLPKVMAA